MKRKKYLSLSLIVVVLLLLAACTGAATPTTSEPSSEDDAATSEQETDSTEEPAETPVAETEEEPTAETEEAQSEEPAADDEVRRVVVAQGEGVESWDPPAGWDTASEWIEMNVYDCLVFPDRETGELVGWLAEDWEQEDDTTWRFNLRQDVTFHNGDPFTADDVKYSIDRILNGTPEEFIVFDQWAFVDEVTVIDDHTVEITADQPDPSFLSALGGTGCGIVSQDYVEEVGSDGLANAGVGTGPFKLKDYDRESFVVLEANDDYWGGRPEIDELVFRVIPEVSTRVAELQTGGVDIAPGILPQDWERLEADGSLKIVHYLTDRVYGLTLAHTPPPGVDAVATSIPEIRAAIDYAIDREALVELAGGYGEPTLTRLTPPLPCWDTVDPPLYGVNPYDPDRARELMEEAGYPDVPGGPVITLHGTTGQYIAQREIAETIAAMLEEVGFEVELDIQEFSTFREGVYQGNNEELMLQSLGNITTDPWLYILNYDSQFGERIPSRTRHSDEEIDTLAEQANTEMDPERRCEILNEFAHVVAEFRPTIELFQMGDAVAMRSNMEWTPPADGNLLFLNLRFTD